MVGRDNPVGPSHQCHAAPARIACFGRRPLSAPPLVQFDGDDLILAPNPRDRVGVTHARVMTEFPRPYKLNRKSYYFASPKYESLKAARRSEEKRAYGYPSRVVYCTHSSR